MKRCLAVVTALAVLLAGCATQQPWTPTVDTYGSSRAQYVNRDMEECRRLAHQTSGDAGTAGMQGAVTGGLIGAAAGAAIGAAFGNAGRGAAVGGVGGALTQGAGRARQSEQQYQRAYVNCMRQRGHRVIN
jgi:outer membrane lipoprotein SlyB